MNVGRPSGRSPRVWGLAMSWNSAPKRRAWPRVRPSASGSSSCSRIGGRMVAEDGLEVGLQRRSSGSSTSTVWSVDVQVVEAALLDALQRDQLGQHDARARRSARPAPAPSSTSGADHGAAQLGVHALGRGLGQARRGAPRSAARSPRRARSPARPPGAPAAAGAAGRRRRPAGPARAGRPPPGRRARRGGRARSPPASGTAIALMREVAPRQVLLDRLALQRRHVHLEAALAVQRAPGAERLRQREHRAAERPGHAPRRLLGVAGHRQVQVAQRAAEERVAHDAAHQPRLRPAAPGPRAGPAPARRSSSALRGHQTSTRRTRGRQPAGDLVVDGAQPARHLLGEDAPRRPARRSARPASPTATSVSGPRSTVTLSMLTVPTSGWRRPPISTSQSLVSARRQPSP